MTEQKDQKVMVINKKISPLVKIAESLEIKTKDDARAATETLSQMNTYVDQVEAEEESIVGPAKAIIKKEQSRWKPIKDLYKPAILQLRSKLGEYQTEQLAIQRAEEEKIASRIKPGKGNLSMEKGVEQLDAVEKPEQTVSTDAGVVKFRTDKKLKVLDLSAIPREYFDLNESKLLADLKAGKIVKGADIIEVQTPMNYR